MSLRLSMLVLACLALFGAAPAIACEARDVKYEATFDKKDTGWGTPGAEISWADGKMVLKPKSNSNFWAWNTEQMFEEADICVEFKLSQGVWSGDTGAGLLFGVKDSKDFYCLQFQNEGRVLINQSAGGSWAPQVLNSLAYDVSFTKPIELRLVARKTSLEVLVNGKQVAKFNKDLPQGGWRIGVYAQSAEVSNEVAFEFTQFKVSTAGGSDDSDDLDNRPPQSSGATDGEASDPEEAGAVDADASGDDDLRKNRKP